MAVKPVTDLLNTTVKLSGGSGVVGLARGLFDPHDAGWYVTLLSVEA